MLKIKFIHIRILIYIISIFLTALVVVGEINVSCYFKDNFGITCPACGLTRATISLVKFDLKSAIEFNAYYTCIIIPILLFLVINDIYTFFKRDIFNKKSISFIEIIFGENNFGGK